MRRSLPVYLGLAAFAGVCSLAAGATLTVTNTSDAGAGSLRQAITDANATVAADTIAFNIPGAGVHTITPASPLPELTEPVIVNGYTQPGASPNTNLPDQGLNSVLRIEINCTTAGQYCLSISADNVTIRGLVLNNTSGYAIRTDFFQQIQNPVVEGCYIGTSADGMSALPLGGGLIFGQHKNGRIGGTTPAARNLMAGGGSSIQISIGNALDNNSVIQGNFLCTDKTGAVPIGPPLTRYGIGMTGGPSSETSNTTIGGLTAAAANVFGCPTGIRLTSMIGASVQGNRIGVDPSGTKGIGPSYGTGIYVEGGNNTNVIGGTAAGAGNVIGGLSTGIFLAGGVGTVVQGNFIGTDASETRDLGNALHGLSVGGTDIMIGGTGPGEANSILYNRGGGVEVGSGTGNTIRGNRIFGNLGATSSGIPSIGIDLRCFISGCGGPVGPNPNDPGDADGPGGNDLQNFPILTSAVPEGGGTRVIGTLDSIASSSFTLDFYADPACRARPRAPSQADQYVGSTNVSTNASGIASFNVLLPTPITAGQPVTATATDANGSTSEFSPEIVFSSTPIAGTPAGGTTLTIEGMLFVAGATVSVGGSPATGVVVNSATEIRANAPARPVGTVHDIVVTLPGGLSGRLRNGYVSRFADVTSFDAFIAKLSANGITAGCGAGNYCPDGPVTRAQMAVFLLRGKKGLCYLPPPATGTVFGDVASNSFAAAWIEELSDQGVTAGCGGGNYCPNSAVTRAQMAVFLLRTLNGPAYVPPPCTTPTFADVPCANGFAPWIEDLVDRGITAGCGGGFYCPNSINTRGQMAVFISTTFGLP